MTDKTNLIREIHEYVTAHGGENTATHLLVQAASAIQTQAAELEAVGAGGVSGPLMGRASLSANAGDPVAWQYRSLPDVGGVWFDCTKERADLRAARPEIWEVRALYAAPPTAQAEGWTKASKQLPPCREDQLYIGINTAGFAGVFNAVRVVNGNTYCLMEVAEESVSIMSDLAIWKPFNPPTSAEGVEP